eukprot:TRINITY_DN32412_c0_g1_i1.p1 TRINITY_DN32412_c0_g1~~TRINITY_DN32412_c0_g1_i1.p1  ORF type:complete len:198 (+),score=35.42 TRINITY_DN32412_c0_g1_i1:44-595(+)
MASSSDPSPVAMWRRFSPTPENIKEQACRGRVWAGGFGLQCSIPHKMGEIHCDMHNQDKWKVHGNVDGPIPEEKLKEFQNEFHSTKGFLRKRLAQAVSRKELEDMKAKQLHCWTTTQGYEGTAWEEARQILSEKSVADSDKKKVIDRIMQQQELDLWSDVTMMFEVDQSGWESFVKKRRIEYS